MGLWCSMEIDRAWRRSGSATSSSDCSRGPRRSSMRPAWCRPTRVRRSGRRWRSTSRSPMSSADRAGSPPEHYQRPGWFTTHVFNPSVAALTRLGISVYGSRVLEVRGRTSGEWRRTPVNLLRFESTDYLVAPRGHTQWVKNLRASGQGRLRVGRRLQQFTAVELADDEKPPLLRAYLKKWK